MTDPYATPSAAVDGTVAEADLDELSFLYALQKDRRQNLHKVVFLVLFVLLIPATFWVAAEYQLQVDGGYYIKGTAMMAAVISAAISGVAWVATRFTVLLAIEARAFDAFARSHGLAPELLRDRT